MNGWRAFHVNEFWSHTKELQILQPLYNTWKSTTCCCHLTCFLSQTFYLARRLFSITPHLLWEPTTMTLHHLVISSINVLIMQNFTSWRNSLICTSFFISFLLACNSFSAVNTKSFTLLIFVKWTRVFNSLLRCTSI